MKTVLLDLVQTKCVSDTTSLRLSQLSCLSACLTLCLLLCVWTAAIITVQAGVDLETEAVC